MDYPIIIRVKYLIFRPHLPHLLGGFLDNNSSLFSRGEGERGCFLYLSNVQQNPRWRSGYLKEIISDLLCPVLLEVSGRDWENLVKIDLGKCFPKRVGHRDFLFPPTRPGRPRAP